MKRFFLFAALIVGITAIGFSDDETPGFNYDIWFSMGPSFGNSFISGTNLERNYSVSSGLDLSFYAFFGGRNIGFFFNYSILSPYVFLFPTVTNIWKSFEPSVQLDFIPLGVGFGYNISETLKLYFGIGPNVNIHITCTEENSVGTGDYSIGLGIGGDIGFKFKVTRFFNINLGTTVSYNFVGYRETRNYSDKRPYKYETLYSGWEQGYSRIGIKPYILFGVNATR